MAKAYKNVDTIRMILLNADVFFFAFFAKAGRKKADVIVNEFCALREIKKNRSVSSF